MADLVAIIGESGSGKSTSIESLNPKETFIISVLGKPLPFRGWKAKYKDGNYFVTDKADDIIKTLQWIDTKNKDVKNIVIDDFQYIMSNQFMRRAFEKGYDKFTEIGVDVWKIINACNQLKRDGLKVFVLAHSEDVDGVIKMKTIGKLLNEKVTVEGFFDKILLATHYKDSDDTVKYVFETQTNGTTVAKTPRGMFEEFEIPNDLQLVSDAIDKYNEIDTKPEKVKTIKSVKAAMDFNASLVS